MTDIDILDGFRDYLTDTDLANEVTGSICTDGRPKNSELEDIAISVVTNVVAQKQEAVVNVNIYVKDLYNNSDADNPYYMPNNPRARKLARLAWNLLFVGRIQGARFTLSKQIFSPSDCTNWHVINNTITLTTINE